MLDGFLGVMSGVVVDPADMRALSPVELQQFALAQAELRVQARPSLSDLLARANYVREPVVPGTWAEWSASEWLR